MFAADLIWLLEHAPGRPEGGFGVYGETIFKGSLAVLPAGEGPYISVIETGGASPEGTHNDGIAAYRRPSAQLVFRATAYDDASNLAELVWLYLCKVQSQVVNGTWWRSCRPVQEPFDIQPDDKMRARIAFNIDVVKRT